MSPNNRPTSRRLRYGALAVLTIVGVIATALMLSPPLAAQTGTQWVLLVRASIDPAKGRDAVALPAERGRITGLRLQNSGRPLKVSRAVITFATGAVQFEETPIEVAPGASSRAFATREEALAPERLELVFESSAAGPPTLVEIWAQLLPRPAVSPPGIRPEAIRPKGVRPEASAPSPPPAPPAQPRPSSPVGGGSLRGGLAEGYTDMWVFFGTNRRQEGERVKNGRKLALFSGEQGPGLSLGRAVVTIPIEREPGTIPRPEVNLIFARVAFRNEDPRRDFTIAAVDVMKESEFTGAMREQLGRARTFKGQALVFVHGYNVAFDDAIFRTAQIAHDIGFDGPAVTFSWPSRGGTFDYRHDVDTAKASRDTLRALLETVAQSPEVTSVNIIAHSMGNDPLLEVLGRQAEIAGSGGTVKNLKIKEVVLAAPDVSRAAFEQLAEKLKVLPRTGITLYASANDRAMQASKRVASGLVRAGDVPRTGPVVIPGLIETIDVSNASTSFFSTNHSTFAEREHLISDLRILIEFSRHPPSRRIPYFKMNGTRPQQFWQYVPR